MFNSSVKKLQSIFANFRQAKDLVPSDTKFVDLAPKALPEGTGGIYLKALNEAMRRPDVFNIAITGPYGSGKSSVIKTFLAQYKGSPLQLSLASFLPDGEQADGSQPKKVTKQEIERSILQQILYGVDANKLPFSRFKRIKVPKKRISIGTSLIITVGLICGWYLFNKQSEILGGTFFEPFKWFNYFSALAVAALVSKAIHSAYTNSHGLSLKSISLKDVQIAPAATDQESILNRHLDEILYFFQSTKHDLVVIEDLDRFENPDIFVSLREINGLINANEGIKRKRRVRFLYALRDDIFVNTDRTKFFEFIVPIVPVINHSNSIDKFLEHSRRVGLKDLDTQFLRDVSRYLSDLRLIQNIVNEYLVYDDQLTADEDGRLDAKKLLAIIIYKNVMPKDFAALHRQEGVLATVLRRHDEFLANAEKKARSEIADIQARVAKGDAQELRDEAELRKVYAMAVIERIPDNFPIPIFNGNPLRPGQIQEADVLEALMAEKSLRVRTLPRQGYGDRHENVDLKDLEASVDPTRSFEQRKAEIASKSIKARRDLEKQIQELENRLSSMRTRRFNEVFRESAELLDEALAEVGENRDLLKHLILEGHIDDTYYQYISLFHGVRMSPKDDSFLRKIRAYTTPSPDFPLDNVAEVVAEMRPGDFGQAYVLNRSIIDYLFGDETGNATRIAAAVGFISTNFQACADFFRAYYTTGRHVAELVRALVTKWSNFASTVIDSTDGPSHVARILAYASDDVLRRPAAKEALKGYLAANADRVLAERVEFSASLFRSFEVEIDQVSKLMGFPDALSFVAKEGLYRISIDNIACIVHHFFGEEKMEALETRHFSTLAELNNTELLARIDSDFSTYVSDVLLALPTNTEEDVAAIKQVLAREDVEHDLRVEFLEKQTAIFLSLNDISMEFQRTALEGNHVEPTWENCLQFITSEAYDEGVLTAYIQTDRAAAALSRQPIPTGDSALPLRRFVVGNNALGLEFYRTYVRLLPRHFSAFQEVDASKTKILIEERKVEFKPDNFLHLEDLELRVQFLALNFDAYASAKSEYAIDDDFRGKLLQASITDAQKLNVLADVDEAYVSGTPSVAAVVGPLLARSPGAPSGYGAEFIKAIVLQSRDVQAKLTLLNRMHPALSVAEIRDVLRAMPAPYQDIATFGRAPKLEDNEINRQLAGWLEDREVISSVSDTFLGGEIRINTFRKEPE